MKTVEISYEDFKEYVVGNMLIDISEIDYQWCYNAIEMTFSDNTKIIISSSAGSYGDSGLEYFLVEYNNDSN